MMRYRKEKTTCRNKKKKTWQCERKRESIRKRWKIGRVANRVIYTEDKVELKEVEIRKRKKKVERERESRRKNIARVEEKKK